MAVLRIDVDRFLIRENLNVVNDFSGFLVQTNRMQRFSFVVGARDPQLIFPDHRRTVSSPGNGGFPCDIFLIVEFDGKIFRLSVSLLRRPTELRPVLLSETQVADDVTERHGTQKSYPQNSFEAKASIFPLRLHVHAGFSLPQAPGSRQICRFSKRLVNFRSSVSPAEGGKASTSPLSLLFASIPRYSPPRVKTTHGAASFKSARKSSSWIGEIRIVRR